MTEVYTRIDDPDNHTAPRVGPLQIPAAAVDPVGIRLTQNRVVEWDQQRPCLHPFQSRLGGQSMQALRGNPRRQNVADDGPYGASWRWLPGSG